MRFKYLLVEVDAKLTIDGESHAVLLYIANQFDAADINHPILQSLLAFACASVARIDTFLVTVTTVARDVWVTICRRDILHAMLIVLQWGQPGSTHTHQLTTDVVCTCDGGASTGGQDRQDNGGPHDDEGIAVAQKMIGQQTW